MQTKYILLGIFLMVAVAQIYVPASMIMEQRDILESGKLYRFRIQPIDPNDPLRGKYIRLWFADDSFIIPDSIYYFRNQTVYLQIYEGSDGYAKIQNVFKTKPDKDLEFLEATIDYPSYYNDSTRLTIKYPFDRFYLDENKASIAEDIYRESRRNSAKTAWALVKIKNGHAALEDVMINGVPINSIIKEQQNDFQ